MPNFSKLFPFIGQLFPPSGGAPVSPSQVGDDVSFTHELYRPDIKHVFYLTSTNSTGIGAGVNIEFAISSEPLPGYVTIPYIQSIFATGNAGPVRTQIQVVQTTTPLDPNLDIRTGIWSDTFVMVTVDLTADHWVQVPFAVPIPRGNRINSLFETVLAGTTVRARSLALQVPIECVNWMPQMGSSGFVRTGAM